MKNPKILKTTSDVKDLVLYRTGIIAFGCKVLLNSNNPFLSSAYDGPP